jgi:ubiquinone/menaquinone biosynthesis C-methylase UbiE
MWLLSGGPDPVTHSGAVEYVAIGLAAVIAVVLVTAAFSQGREISFWPPRIGPRTEPAPARDQLAAAPEQGRPEFAREFDVTQSQEFYQLIAPFYDQRNSVDLRTTQREAADRIRRMRSGRSASRVLDLGGGTGDIASHFYYDDAIHWTSVDFSPAMVDKFQRNLAGTALAERLEVVIDDLRRAIGRLPQRTYDIVLLSLVLSSMPELPDFMAIARLLRPGGALIIADIDPLYSALHPYYTVRVDGSQLALRTNPVQPLEIWQRAASAGLEMRESTLVKRGQDSYAFLGVFTAPTVVAEPEPANGQQRVRRRLPTERSSSR